MHSIDLISIKYFFYVVVVFENGERRNEEIYSQLKKKTRLFGSYSFLTLPPQKKKNCDYYF